jgi:hypothetical protein
MAIVYQILGVNEWTVVCGTGRSEQQWRWIQPTLVSAGE